MATSNKPWDEDQVIATASTEENGAEETAPETNYNDAVQELYIAYYGRPADPAGLAYWAAQAEAAGGVAGIIGDFTTSAESAERIESQGNLAFINGVHNNLYGTDASAAKRAEWLDQLNEGATRSSVALSILNDQETSAVRSNKLEAANRITSEIEASGQAYTIEQIAAIREIMAKVTGAEDYFDESVFASDLAAAIADFPEFVGEEFALTAGEDRVQGTDADNVFTAATATGSRTLDAADKIGGGQGQNTLVVEHTGVFNGFTDGYLRDVQTIQLNQGATGYNFNATNARDVQTFILRGENVGDLQGLSLNRNTDSLVIDTENLQNNIEFRFIVPAGGPVGDGNPVVVDGEELDVRELELKLVDTGVRADAANNVSENRVAIDITNPLHNRLTLTVEGDNILNLSNAGASQQLQIQGAGDVHVSNVYTQLRDVLAGDAEGNLYLDLTNATNIQSVLLGSGDNVLVLDQDQLVADATLNGGAGNNRLVMTEADGTVKPTADAFQTLEIRKIGASQKATIAADEITGLNTVMFTGANGLAGGALLTGDEVTIANVNNPLTTIFKGAQTMTAGGIVRNDAGGEATVRLQTRENLVDETQDALSSVKFNATNATSMVLTAEAYTNTSSTSTFRAGQAETLTLNVDRGLNENGVNLTLFAAEVSANQAGSYTVNANGKLANAVLNVNKATTGTLNFGDIFSNSPITVNANADTHVLKLNAADQESLTVVARGNATVTTDPSKLESLETLDITAWRTFNISAVAMEEINSVTLRGDREMSRVELGALGVNNFTSAVADDLDDMSITATGLEEGLHIASIFNNVAVIDANHTGGAVSLNIAGVRAGVKNSSNTATVEVTGGIDARSISVDGAGMRAAAVDLGNLVATGRANEAGSVNLQFAGARMNHSTAADLKVGTVTLGRSATDNTTGGLIKGGNFTLNANGLQGNLEVGNITWAGADANVEVNIDARNVLGEVSIGAINVGTADNATPFAPATDDFDDLLGTVKLQLNGITEDGVVIGAITAKSVTIEAANLLGSVGSTTPDTWGTITAQTVNFEGASLYANKLTVNASKGGTIKGGLEDDTFTINGYAASGEQAEFTVTGGEGKDTFTISNAATAAGTTFVTITDFVAGDDKVDGFTIDSTIVAATDKDDIIAAMNAFDGFSLAADANVRFVEIDINGNGTADQGAVLYDGNVYVYEAGKVLVELSGLSTFDGNPVNFA